MIIFLSIVVLLVLAIFFYSRQDKFGAGQSKENQAAFSKSPNYKNGQFHNLSDTPQLTEGHTMFGLLYSFLFKKHPRRRPIDTISTIKTNLLKIPLEEEVLVWFGHSSYYLQLNGKCILVDPVFSGNASPLPGSIKSFDGTNVYSVGDLPKIDYLFISHDHYDHVDYETLVALKNKVGAVICGLGVGAHFEKWGYAKTKILEGDWGDSFALNGSLKVHVTPARHFSGRDFGRNKTLWASYVLEAPDFKIFIGGDSGYDVHFARIGVAHGPFDLAILENGQYDAAWKYIHMMPHEVLQAGKDLEAKRVFPVHSSKFALADHPWDEPLKKITEFNKEVGSSLVTPQIGQIVYLRDTTTVFKAWWEGLE